MKQDTKVLVMCQGGNDRSVSLAFILKWERKYNNVVVIGCDYVQPDTMKMLGDWAEVIFIPADKYVFSKLPEKYHPKTVFFDIGPDKWGNPFHPELQGILRQALDEFEQSLKSSRI